MFDTFVVSITSLNIHANIKLQLLYLHIGF